MLEKTVQKEDQREKKKGVFKRRAQNIPFIQEFDTAEITLQNAVEIVANISISEGYRERTISDYRKFWKEFSSIVNKKLIRQVNTSDIRFYIKALLEDRGLSPVTVNIRLTAVRAIFNRLFREKIIEVNPLEGIRKLKTDEEKIYTLTDNQVKRLFAVVKKDTFPGFRDYVAMLTMLKCGLRSNEINSLEVNDVDFENRVIMLPGYKNKNRKSRSIPMSKKVASNMSQLIAETKEYFGKDITHVFTNQFGEPLVTDHLRKRMDRYSREAGLKSECRASPHSLRHTFAANALKAGLNIRTLMSIMGHKDISTTQKYLFYSDDQIKNQYNEIELKDHLDV